MDRATVLQLVVMPWVRRGDTHCHWHVSRETVGASTTFSARYYSYDAGLRIMWDVCEDQHVGDSNSRRAEIAGLSDLLDKNLSTE